MLRYVPGVLFMFLAYRVYQRVKRERRSLDRYDFEHRSSLGGVTYASFEDSEKRARTERGLIWRLLLMTLLMLAAIIWLMLAAMLKYH